MGQDVALVLTGELCCLAVHVCMRARPESARANLPRQGPQTCCALTPPARRAACQPFPPSRRAGIGPTAAGFCTQSFVTACGDYIESIIYSGTSGWSPQVRARLPHWGSERPKSRGSTSLTAGPRGFCTARQSTCGDHLSLRVAAMQVGGTFNPPNCTTANNKTANITRCVLDSVWATRRGRSPATGSVRCLVAETQTVCGAPRINATDQRPRQAGRDSSDADEAPAHCPEQASHSTTNRDRERGVRGAPLPVITIVACRHRPQGGRLVRVPAGRQLELPAGECQHVACLCGGSVAWRMARLTVVAWRFSPCTRPQASWSQQAFGWPNQCFRPNQTFGPSASFLYGDCVFAKDNVSVCSVGLRSHRAHRPSVLCSREPAACPGLDWCLIFPAAAPCCMTRAAARSVDARRTHTHTRAPCSITCLSPCL